MFDERMTGASGFPYDRADREARDGHQFVDFGDTGQHQLEHPTEGQHEPVNPTEGQAEPINPTEGQNYVTGGEGQNHPELAWRPDISQEEKDRLVEVISILAKAHQITDTSDAAVEEVLEQAFGFSPDDKEAITKWGDVVRRLISNERTIILEELKKK